MADNIRKMMNQRVSSLERERERWKTHWSECRDYIMPEHGYALDDEDGYNQNDGEKKHSLIIDATASDAVEVLAAGLQSGMTSPARPFFKLVPSDPGMLNYGPAKEWLAEVERLLFYVFSRSNIYNAFHHSYLEIGGFSTAAMAIMENYDTVIRARPFTIGEYALAVNADNKVDTFYRTCRMSARAFKEKFGTDRLSNAIKNALTSRPDDEFVMCQMIEPNDDRFKVKDARGRKFRSIYWEKHGDGESLLNVAGYNEFPVASPRWTVVGNQTYGRGPGMKVLGDVKMLQKLQEKSLIALDKQVEPPVQAPGSLKNENINSMPGGVSYYDETTSGAGIRPLYDMRVDLQAVEFKIQQTQSRIREGLYNDLFKMLASMPDRQRTAREVAERHEEKLLMLGPVLTRLQNELHDVIIQRTYEIISRNGMLPPPPPELGQVGFRPEYISMLATAQRMVGSYGLEETAAFAGAITSIKPDVADIIDWDAGLRSMADMKGVDPKLIRSEEDIASIRQQRAQQMAQAQAVEAASKLGPAAKAFSEIPLGQNNALGQVLGGVQR